jgi:hypothetical protein
MRKSRAFFICQQGFALPNANPHLYSALMLQPRIIGALVIAGTIFQSRELFLMLSAVLAWSTLAPRQSLFDAIYNYAVAAPRRLPPLPAAPAPRRFAQAAASALSLAVGLALLGQAAILAWILEAGFIIAIASAVIRRFCVPAHLYFVIRRKLAASLYISLGDAGQVC